MSIPDPQLSRWIAYSAVAAVSTVVFMALGMAGLRWVHRAATRVGVIAALTTVFCMTAGLSTFLSRDSRALPNQPREIEWCKRVSCALPEDRARQPLNPAVVLPSSAVGHAGAR